MVSQSCAGAEPEFVNVYMSLIPGEHRPNHTMPYKTTYPEKKSS
jgi:hypothetical protein